MNTYRYNKNINIMPKVKIKSTVFNQNILFNYDNRIKIIILNFIKTMLYNNLDLSIFFHNLQSLKFKVIKDSFF